MRGATLVLLILMGACSSGSGAGGGGAGGGTAGDPQAVCTASCNWRSKCGRPSADCVAECQKDTATYAGKWTAAYTNAVSTCFASLACSQNDDDCVGNFAGADPAYPNIPEVQRCLARRGECSVPDAGPNGTSIAMFSDDYCQTIAALTVSARAAADACRAKPCEQVRECLKSAGAFNF